MGACVPRSSLGHAHSDTTPSATHIFIYNQTRGRDVDQDMTVMPDSNVARHNVRQWQNQVQFQGVSMF